MSCNFVVFDGNLLLYLDSNTRQVAAALDDRVSIGIKDSACPLRGEGIAVWGDDGLKIYLLGSKECAIQRVDARRTRGHRERSCRNLGFVSPLPRSKVRSLQHSERGDV